MTEILLDSKTPVKIRIFRQWLAVVTVRVPAFPKAGPAVDQRLPVVFLVEQQEKPADDFLAAKAAEQLGTSSVTVSSIEVYPTDRVQYAPVKDELQNPAPDAPAEK